MQKRGREEERERSEAKTEHRLVGARSGSEMKVMVAVKRVVDYAVKIRVKPDKVRCPFATTTLHRST